jgi:glutathione S-transferase
MITLYAFGPFFGLPDPSPFVLKTLTQLRMSGLPHRLARGGPPSAPKGKLPYIEDDGAIIPDSVFIEEHLRRAHGVDLNAGLTPRQAALAWALERMLEDHLYWAILHARWANEANFAKGPSQFFAGAPEAVKTAARERAMQNLYGHGMGRHSEAEVAHLAARDLAAAAELLDDGPYLFGASPCAADATLFAFTASALAPVFDTPIREAAASHYNLVVHKDRIMDRYFAPAMAD